MTSYRHPVLPELLAPAGSPEALEAALLAGADAVYLGGSRFNARMNAHNFDTAQLREAVTHAHRLGGRVYLTLNTLVWDRELPEALEAAYEAAVAGVDALIIADVGAAALIHRALPELSLHASTQLSGHNASVGDVLAPFGFSRFVIARETSLTDLAFAVAHNPLEVEVFIHGALCVSHSGQCLFSSVVGGRSGNRGECAQPCRLPYSCAGCRSSGKNPPGGGDRPSARPDADNYPLSLKDLSLACHVPSLIEAGVSSLKIEGRMKSPGYVSGVTAIWRRLLNENRAATPEEMNALGNLFSRGGFTDGYQTRKITRTMMGIRSEGDKERTATAEKAAMSMKHPPHLPLSMVFTAETDKPVTLTATAPLYRQGSCEAVSVTVEGDVPATAENLPLTAETAEKQLTRTGGTPYLALDVATHIDSGLMLPVSRLNALRREALDRLDEARMTAMPNPAAGYTPLSPALLSEEICREIPSASSAPSFTRTARFFRPEQITAAAVTYFDVLYLPLGREHPGTVPTGKQGILLPPVIFDREADVVAEALTATLRKGIRHLLVGNVGHLPLIRRVTEACGIPEESLCIHGDLRLNTANTPAAARMLSLGFCDLILSPELTLPRMRDIRTALAKDGFPAAAGGVVYGRLPLMLTEKCAIREVYRHMKLDSVCREICGKDAAVMRDRMGKDFPILREDSPCGAGHRNTLYNSLPTGMSDRMEELARAELSQHHFIFSVESPADTDRVITAYKESRPLGTEVRRMQK
ncbi:MAG: U32 family peptidase [Ruminococcaceae bacterium]|nr:U32 family peptidase [Oscillospiraceae bacterium]